MPNFVKYYVDCFSLLFVVPVVLVAYPAASSLRQVGGFLREVVVPRAQQYALYSLFPSNLIMHDASLFICFYFNCLHIQTVDIVLFLREMENIHNLKVELVSLIQCRDLHSIPMLAIYQKAL